MISEDIACVLDCHGYTLVYIPSLFFLFFKQMYRQFEFRARSVVGIPHLVEGLKTRGVVVRHPTRGAIEHRATTRGRR